MPLGYFYAKRYHNQSIIAFFPKAKFILNQIFQVHKLFFVLKSKQGHLL